MDTIEIRRHQNLYITCPYCGKHFKNNGHPELQKCPKCQSKLLV